MLHTLETNQFLKSDLATVWEFMSSPKNLALITPAHMNFKIIGDEAKIEKMYPGQLIEYHITPLLNLKMHWVTEITHVKHLSYFVDEQRKGPYSLWHHKHFLTEVNGGVEMKDVVHYKLPFGIFGKLANTLVVKKQLQQIFDFRYNKLNKIFNNN